MANFKFQYALQGQVQNCPPIWFMRQAGRYHRHYQTLREKYSFIQLCKEPELATQVTLGPIQDFDFDVAILFSDLLFPLEALGMGLEYGDSGPKLGWHLRPENLIDLRKVDDALPLLQFQKTAMKMTREALKKDKSLIGFVGGPWTLFTYAAQGKHDGNLVDSKMNLPLFSPFCEVIVPLLIENIRLQLEGGAEIVMLFDTAAGEISPALFQEEVVPQLKKLAYAFPQKLGYYSKGTQPIYFTNELFKEGFFAGMGYDHRWDLPSKLKENHRGFIQGNFDQALLFSPLDDFKKHLEDYIKSFSILPLKARTGWVCGLGHGVLPKTPEDHVKRFVDTIRERMK